MINDITIGAAITACRKSTGTKQSDLALVVDISQSYLSQIEHGKREPSRKMVTALANTFNLNYMELLQLADSLPTHTIPIIEKKT